MSHDPPETGYALWLAVSLLGTTASGHRLIEAVRRGSSLSAWVSAAAFVAFSLASALETLVLFGHT